MWYNSAWNYRLPVPITNTSATSALSYCQVPVAIGGAAYTAITTHGQSTLADIVVTDADGLTSLPFALEEIDRTNSVVYLLVKASVPANSTKTIYVYYGNPSASSLSNYSTTVGPSAALPGELDIANQSNAPGINWQPQIIRFRHQDQPHGGGASLNGKLFCVLMTGGTTNQPFNQCSLSSTTSSNSGATWSTPLTLVSPASNHSFYARSLAELPDGTLVLIYTYGVTSTLGSVDPNFVAVSTNGGATWSNLSTSASNSLNVVADGGNANATAYGPILIDGLTGNPVVTYYSWTTAPSYNLYLITCAFGVDYTNGSNWSIKGTISSSSTRALSETALCQTAPGQYIAVSRDDSPSTTYDLWITATTGANSGAAWGTPVRMNLPGVGTGNGTKQAVSPWLQPLASGNVALFWGLRYGTTSYGIAAALITDTTLATATWLDRPIAQPFVLSQTGNNAPNNGYPTADLNTDGSIALVFCYTPLNTTAETNVGYLKITEDWLANQGNQYDACQGFGSAWTSVGANATVDTAHTLNGAAHSLKFDNSAGAAANAYRNSWSSDVTVQVPHTGFTAWRYDSQIDTNQGNTLDIYDGSGNRRTLVNTLGSPAERIQWYDGSTYHDFGPGVTESLSQWNRHAFWANVGAAGGVTGSFQLNSTTSYSGLGQDVAGSVPQSVFVLAGHITGTSNSTFWLGTFYTHQYTASVPAVTTGSEQSYGSQLVSGSGALLLLLAK